MITKTIGAFFLSWKTQSTDWKMIQNDFLFFVVLFQNFVAAIYRQLSFKNQSIVLSNSRLFFSS